MGGAQEQAGQHGRRTPLARRHSHCPAVACGPAARCQCRRLPSCPVQRGECVFGNALVCRHPSDVVRSAVPVRLPGSMCLYNKCTDYHTNLWHLMSKLR